MLISKPDLNGSASGGLVEATGDRDNTTEDFESEDDDLGWEEEATDEDDDESESEKTKLARTSTKFFVSRRSRPFFSLPFRITLSTTSSAGSSSSDLAKICRKLGIHMQKLGS